MKILNYISTFIWSVAVVLLAMGVLQPSLFASILMALLLAINSLALAVFYDVLSGKHKGREGNQGIHQ